MLFCCAYFTLCTLICAFFTLCIIYINAILVHIFYAFYLQVLFWCPYFTLFIHGYYFGAHILRFVSVNVLLVQIFYALYLYIPFCYKYFKLLQHNLNKLFFIYLRTEIYETILGLFEQNAWSALFRGNRTSEQDNQGQTNERAVIRRLQLSWRPREERTRVAREKTSSVTPAPLLKKHFILFSKGGKTFTLFCPSPWDYRQCGELMDRLRE